MRRTGLDAAHDRRPSRRGETDRRAHRLLLRLRFHPVRSRRAHVAGEGAREIRTPGAAGQSAAAPSAQATLAAAARDPALIRLLTDPFALTPGFTGPSQPSGLIPEYDPSMNVWLVPFPMAPINTKNVHRTNFLLGHPYGTDFVYDEMMVAPGFGEIARVTTQTFATMVSLVATGGLKPGAGPTREEREKGFYDILFLGELPDGGRVEAVVTGDRDPGYGSTSKMIAESALCLVRDVQGEGGPGTPGALMGPALRKRLKERAGLTFSAR